MNKYLFFLLIFSLSAFSQQINRGRDLGLGLMNNYSCRSKGAKTVEQLAGFNSIDGVIQSMRKSPECATLLGGLNGLPSFSEITNNLSVSIEEQAIIEQETIINQSLSDLDAIRSGEISEDELSLFPSTEILESTIVSARVRLNELKAELAFNQFAVSKEKYVIGINQLGEITQSIDSILSQPDHKCFKENPSAIGQLIAGIGSVSGFFMNQPMGIITNLAGKTLQSLISITESLVRNAKESSAFKGMKDTNLVMGVQCALESLGTQRCNLEREFGLFKKIAKNKTHSVKDFSSETQCYSEIAVMSNKSIESIQKVVDWVNQSNSMGLGVFGGLETQRNANALNQFETSMGGVINKLNNVETSIVGATEEARGESRAQKLLRGVMGMSVHSSVREIERNPVLATNAVAKSTLSQRQQDELILKLIMPANTTGSEITIMNEKLRELFIADRLRQDVTGNLSRADIPDQPSGFMISQLLNKYPNWNNAINKGQIQEPITTIVKQLSHKNSTSNVLSNVATVKRNVQANLSSSVPEEKVQRLVLDFFGSTSSSNSPFDELKNLKTYLNNAKQLNLDKVSKGVLDIGALEEKIDEIIILAETKKGSLESGEKVGTEEWMELIGKLDKVVGTNNNLNNSIVNINKSIQRYVVDNLQDLKSKKKINKQQYADLLFFMNKGVVQSSIAVSDTPTNQFIDYNNALRLNKDHTKGLQNFLGDKLEKAFRIAQEDDDPTMLQKL